MNRKYLFWLIAVVTVVVDQITKALVNATLAVGQSISVFPTFSLTHIRNTGAGFGVLQGQNSIFILVALITIVVIITLMKKIVEKHHTTVFASLILGGAVGNLIDRLVYGSVTDFLSFTFWPAFNVADAALTIGVLGLIWMEIREEKSKK